jgi:hypothetical protein
MDVDQEHADVLQNIEFAIVTMFRREPLIVDLDVENAVNSLVTKYQAQAQNHEPPFAKTKRARPEGLRPG